MIGGKSKRMSPANLKVGEADAVDVERESASGRPFHGAWPRAFALKSGSFC